MEQNNFFLNWSNLLNLKWNHNEEQFFFINVNKIYSSNFVQFFFTFAALIFFFQCQVGRYISELKMKSSSKVMLRWIKGFKGFLKIYC